MVACKCCYTKVKETPQAKVLPGEGDRNCSAVQPLLGGFRLGAPLTHCCWKRLLFWGRAILLQKEVSGIKIALWIVLQIRWERDALAQCRYAVADRTNSAGLSIVVQLSNPKLNKLLVFSIWTPNFSSGDMHLGSVTLSLLARGLPCRCLL